MTASWLEGDNLVDLIWATTTIELRDISRKTVKEILAGRCLAGLSLHDVRVVVNVKQAWQFLVNNTAYPLDWAYVSAYNSLVGQGLVHEAGRLRIGVVHIGGSSYIPPIPALDSAEATLQAAIATPDPVLRGIKVFLTLCRSQFFNDGNKRTALLAANHQMLHDKAGILAIPPGRQEFFKLLTNYYESKDDSRAAKWLRANAVKRLPSVVD